MKVTFIIGTRPQIVKSSRLINIMDDDPDFDVSIIHTGQHYDYAMSTGMFNELKLPRPDHNCNVGSKERLLQVTDIMYGLNDIQNLRGSDLVVVPGDTNSALAATLAASMMGLPVAHLEAGARSHNMGMTEEYNRRIIDHTAELLLAPSQKCYGNLVSERVPGEIHLVGDTLYDVFVRTVTPASDIPSQTHPFVLLTIHRAENTDNSANLRNILSGLEMLGVDVVFTIHPRTAKMMREYGIAPPRNVASWTSVTYPLFRGLLAMANAVVTDSGGVQKEAYWSGCPCVTVRRETEWTETIDAGANTLCAADPEDVMEKTRQALEKGVVHTRGEFGDGYASEKIMAVIRGKYLK